MQNIIAISLVIFSNFLGSMNFILLQTNNVEDNEFNLFLFSLLILGLIFVCLSTLIAILLAVMALLIIFCFIAVGALSASVLIGINKKSVTAGFRTFVIVFSSFSMTIIGAISFWVFNRIVHWWTQFVAIIAGSVTGLISGLIAGLLLAYLIKKFSSFLKTKLHNSPDKIV